MLPAHCFLRCICGPVAGVSVHFVTAGHRVAGLVRSKPTQSVFLTVTVLWLQHAPVFARVRSPVKHQFCSSDPVVQPGGVASSSALCRSHSVWSNWSGQISVTFAQATGWGLHRRQAPTAPVSEVRSRNKGASGKPDSRENAVLQNGRPSCPGIQNRRH